MTVAAGAAAAWGVSDFLAGALSRRVPVLTVLLGSQIAAMLLALLVAAVRGLPPPLDARLWLGVAAGVVGLPAMGLLYRAMRDGSPAVVAPVAAVAALVPTGWGLLHGDRLDVIAGLGVGVGLLGVTMAGWPVAARPGGTKTSDTKTSDTKTSDTRTGDTRTGKTDEAPGRHGGRDRPGRRPASLCALGAALGIGVYFVLLHEAGEADEFWALVSARVAEGLGALVLALALGRCDRTLLRVPIVAVGASDALADAAFVAAAASALTPASVVASLYPAVTILLNRSLLRERLHKVHLYGVLAALLSVACLAR
jgi:drug/metabolite transporter (DMT)-like permease